VVALVVPVTEANVVDARVEHQHSLVGLEVPTCANQLALLHPAVPFCPLLVADTVEEVATSGPAETAMAVAVSLVAGDATWDYWDDFPW
jgi:hypothetical protein